MTFSYQSTWCGTCKGNSEYSEQDDAGFVTVRCDECDRGKVEACCTDCGKVLPLNDAGECERCVDAYTLPIARFNLKWNADLRKDAA